MIVTLTWLNSKLHFQTKLLAWRTWFLDEVVLQGSKVTSLSTFLHEFDRADTFAKNKYILNLKKLSQNGNAVINVSIDLFSSKLKMVIWKCWRYGCKRSKKISQSVVSPLARLVFVQISENYWENSVLREHCRIHRRSSCQGSNSYRLRRPWSAWWRWRPRRWRQGWC